MPDFDRVDHRSVSLQKHLGFEQCCRLAARTRAFLPEPRDSSPTVGVNRSGDVVVLYDPFRSGDYSQKLSDVYRLTP